VTFADLGEEVSEDIQRMHHPFFKHSWATCLSSVPALHHLLQKGVAVLDIGCGGGGSSFAVARAFPNSTVVAIDPDESSISRATLQLRESPGIDNLCFIQADVENFVEHFMASNEEFFKAKGALEFLQKRRVWMPTKFTLVTAYDVVHDMKDPVGSLRAMRTALTHNTTTTTTPSSQTSDEEAGGFLFWSEPLGSRNPMNNRNTQAKMRAAVSPLHCMTVSLAQG